MQEILSQLQSVPPEHVMGTLALLLFVAAMGLAPTGSTDLILATAGVFSGVRSVNLFAVIAVAFFAIASAETSLFLIGRAAGTRLLRVRLFEKHFPKTARERLSDRINSRPIPLMLAVRLVPVLRACTTLSMGTLGLGVAKFFRIHPWILLLYTVIVVSVFRALGARFI